MDKEKITGSSISTGKEKGRGGARPGAGRPKGDSRMISFRAPGRLAEQLDRIGNRTEFIRNTLEKAVREKDAGKSLNIIPAEKARPLSLPYFDIRVVAGFPVPLDNDERSQDIDILTMLCPHPEASYLIRVSGDSMIDAGLMNGDIVIVDKSNRNPSPHEIAMCELNGEYTLKHLVLEDGQGWLVPANPDYPRLPISPDDDFSIWGTVTYIIHKAREQ
ncbi:MAG: LexA family protein [Candidatus Cryptobacteroides sp.]